MLNDLNYVHGYSDYESNRLNDQAETLNELLHFDSLFPENSSVLEIGCGVGAQTIILGKKNKSISLTSVDISEVSLMKAKQRCELEDIQNVRFIHADVYNLPFADKSFDHIFVCFFLEHLPAPSLALQKLKKLLRPGGTICIIEGDHGSAYYYPESNYAQATIECLINIQASHGGDPLIGRSLYPLLQRNAFSNITVSPRMVYADDANPQMVDGFTVKTFIAMVEGVGELAVMNGLISSENWKKGIIDLNKTAGPEGVFCYTFFKAYASI
jgi:ubiquinone/menaquinone biosynthesis C-methylase UbiE